MLAGLQPVLVHNCNIGHLNVPRTGGVYIVHLTDGKVYIGISKNVHQRLHEHLRPSKGAKSAITKAEYTLAHIDRVQVIPVEPYSEALFREIEKSLIEASGGPMGGDYTRAMDLEQPWSEELRVQWERGGYGGLLVDVPARVARKMSLDFLRDLPGLCWLDLDGRFPNDDVAFELSALEVLALWTASTSPLRLGELGKLRSLSVKGQRPVTAIKDAERLEWLFVAVSGCTSLDFLGSKPNLSTFRWERAKGDDFEVPLAGLSAAPKLETIQLYDFEVGDLAELRGMHDLAELELIGPWRKVEQLDGVVDLEPLVGLSTLKSLAIVGMARPLASLEPLLRMPGLAHLRLGGCTVADGDISPLLQLPQQVITVGPPRNHPTHSHKAEDIQAARRAMRN